MNTTILTTSTEIYSKTIAECLKTTSDFSGDTIQNICTGQINFVANGSWDLFLIGVVVVLCTVSVGIIIGFLIEVFTN
jgi:hypothetical protein